MTMSPPVGFLYWYTTSVILGIFTIFNLLKITYRYATRPRSASNNLILNPPSQVLDSPGGSSLEKGQVPVPHQTTFVKRLGNASLIAFEKYVLLTALPLPKIRWWIKRRGKASLPTSELACTGVYALGCFVLCFYGTHWKPKIFANQAGWVAVAQVPLIIALAGKNNLVSCLTGVSYEKLNFLHRASGKVCLITVWIHAIGHWYASHGWKTATWHAKLAQWGVTGLIALTMMFVVSLPMVRRRLYEFFLVTHICLAALALGAFIMHWRAVDVWIYPGIGLWAGDRLFRIIRLIILNRLYPSLLDPTSTSTAVTPTPTSTATLTLLTPSTLKITFPNPAHLTWQAGQHFYIILPGMSRLPWEAHPFTAATIDGDLTFIVRVRDGFTKMMKEKVDEERKERGLGIEEGDTIGVGVKGVVEGPYGQGRDLSRFDGVLILTGGSGISFAIAHLLQIIRDAREGRTRVQHVKIVWMVKSRLHLNWISPILLQHVHNLPPNLRVSLHIHVTKHYLPRPSSLSLPAQAILPANPTEQETSDWEAYMAKRASELPRRRSRLMSTFSWASWTRLGRRLSGPGTRRGSEAILPGEIDKLTPAKKLPRPASDNADVKVEQLEVDVDLEKGDVEKETMAIPTFTWSEGYGDSFPTQSRSRSPMDSTTESGSPLPRRVKRLASEAPSNGPLRESLDENEEDRPRIDVVDIDKCGSIISSRSGSVAPDVVAKRKVSFSDFGAQPRRSDDISPFSSSRGRPSISLDVGEVTPPRKLSITIDEPIHPRRKSSTFSPSPLASRKNSLLAPQPQRMFDPNYLNVTLQPQTTQTPTFLEAPSPLQSIEMKQTGSDTSILSIPPLPSGALTPALSDRIDASQPIPLPTNSNSTQPQQTLESSFESTIELRRRQSIGLESIIHWYEGRADLKSVITEMMVEVNVEQGGWVDVSACGPRSLLDSSKNVVRGLSSVKSTFKGGGGIRFSAETFGW